MGSIKKLIIGFLSGCLALVCSVPLIKRLYLLVSTEYRPTFTAKRDGYDYVFSTPAFTPYWRAETMFDKEPETIEWIDGFDSDDVLYDIGANVGVYTIYAAVRRRASKVMSFEPESQNYALLNENIFLNRVQDRVMCINTALSDVNGLDFLYLSEFAPGGACHTFGEPLDFNRRPTAHAFRQGVISHTLDGFIEAFRPEFPNHIKIDVDGLESEIIKGSRNTLLDGRVKSLLVEINDDLGEDMELIEDLGALGFEVKWKRHSSMFDTGRFSKVYNYCFARKESGVEK
jgi:FkbM family methyltransferase